jgi:hypothetical protein
MQLQLLFPLQGSGACTLMLITSGFNAVWQLFCVLQLVNA